MHCEGLNLSCFGVIRPFNSMGTNTTLFSILFNQYHRFFDREEEKVCVINAIRTENLRPNVTYR